ncbi:MAG: DUF5615 family PIN-like protein [Candidatus Dormibacteraceae bacterium]
MKLLLDEQLCPVIAEQLRTRDHDVLTVEEAELIAHSDEAVFAWAIDNSRAIATNNIRDFRILHANSLTVADRHFGIVLVPSRKYSLAKNHLGPLIAALDALLKQHSAEDALRDKEWFI